ncbi:type II toxin-antitoxin system RelE/ParE family toxin [Rhodobacter sp. CZR27]|uniref:type II toxin-antitoxin system RelE/ParE family toxin n=1 Tax=Rhodobacter sp. CZR27 TaxID=2033869 RepID=UPI000BBEEEBF|nr:type II toxin-antitoxin system RelE/ParE family toxin [Rhodobacter sp. CZR27]
MGYRILPAAAADLQEIADFIALDSPQAALRWLDGLEERFELLGDMPGTGVQRPDLRLLPVGRYLVLYWAVDGDAEIVRVLHGARQWQDLIG